MSRKELNLSELKDWCQELAPTFSQKQIVLLTGDLGAGKTQWVQSMVAALGGRQSSSPTFSVINEYETNRGLVYHVDLYRLESQEELDSVGFWDLFSEPQGLVFVEWASRMKKEEVPVDWQKFSVHIEMGSGDKRVFNYEAH